MSEEGFPFDIEPHFKTVEDLVIQPPELRIPTLGFYDVTDLTRPKDWDMIDYMLMQNSQTTLIEIFKQKSISILDLFSGDGLVPLFLLNTLAKSGFYTPEHEIQVVTVDNRNEPKRLYSVRSVLDLSAFDKNKQEYKEYFKNSSLTSGLLKLLKHRHIREDLFATLQRFNSVSFDFITCFGGLYEYLSPGRFTQEEQDYQLIKRILKENLSRIMKEHSIILAQTCFKENDDVWDDFENDYGARGPIHRKKR